jgi:transcriptional regulator with XRE-family HTH domain
MSQPREQRVTFTPNQIVAHNLRRARMLSGWTQTTAAKELEPLLGERWSKATFSAAERSVAGERIRQFTADELTAFAAVFKLPVSFFFRPPRGVEQVAAPTATANLKPSEMVDLAPLPEGFQEALDARFTALLEQGFGIAVQLEPKEGGKEQEQ